MIAALTLWFKEKALVWLAAHWRDVGCGVAVVLTVLYLRQGGELSACREALAKPPELAQAQNLSGSAKAGSQGSVTIPGRPAVAGRPAQPCPPEKICPACPDCPACPEIQVNFGSSAEAGLQGSQQQNQKPAAAPKPWAASVLVGYPASLGADLMYHDLGGWYVQGLGWQAGGGKWTYRF